MWYWGCFNPMNDVDSYRNCDEYSEYVEYLNDNNVVSANAISIHTIINIILNIMILVSIHIYAFFQNLSFLNYLKFVAICFIVSDIALLFLGKVFMLIGNIFSDINSKFCIIKFNALAREQQLDKIKLWRNKVRDLSNKKNTDNKVLAEIFTYRYNAINKKIMDCQDHIKEVEKLDDVVDNAITKRYNNDVDYVTNVLDGFKKEIPTHSERMQKRMLKISKVADEILITCQNEPLVVSRIMETFNIYIPELLNIVNYYERLNEDGKRENSDTLKAVFSEFEKHLIELKDEIQNNADNAFNLSSELLLESLRKKNKEEKENV